MDPTTLAAYKTLRLDGLMTMKELAERVGIPIALLRQRLWGHIKLGRIEVVLSLTREGVDFLSSEIAPVTPYSRSHDGSRDC